MDELIDLTKEMIKISSSAWDDESIYNYVFDYLKNKRLDPKKGNKEEYSLKKICLFSIL
jgi:hypothetical protein